MAKKTIKENPYLLADKPSDEVLEDFSRFKELSVLDENQLMARLRIQSDEGYLFVANVREQMQADYMLFLNQKKDKSEDKLGDTTLYNTHCQFMAREYTGKPNFNFVSTDGSQDDTVRALNSAKDEDWKDSSMASNDYFIKFYKYLFGPGITIKEGWDAANTRNVFKVVDPRLWICDPNGDYVTNKFAYTGIDMLKSFQEMSDSGYMNLDRLAPTQLTQRSESLLKSRDQGAAGLGRRTTNNAENAYYDCYLHFCTVPCNDGQVRKVAVMTGNNRGQMLSVRFLKESTKQQEKNPELVPWPISVEYWKPKPNDPMGDRPANYVRDVQRHKAILANLRMKKAQAELYPMYFYNKKYLENPNNLQFGFNKFIALNTGVDGAVPIDSIVKPFRPDARADWTLTMDASMDQQVERSTSMNAITAGSTPERREAATTNKLVSDNTDINLSLNGKIANWGRESLARLWLQGYLENFETGDKKLVLIATGSGHTPYTLKQKDFFLASLCRIVVESDAEVLERREKEKFALMNVNALIAASPDVPGISKLMMLRDLVIASGVSDVKIPTHLPHTPQEALAKDEN